MPIPGYLSFQINSRYPSPFKLQLLNNFVYGIIVKVEDVTSEGQISSLLKRDRKHRQGRFFFLLQLYVAESEPSVFLVGERHLGRSQLHPS